MNIILEKFNVEIAMYRGKERSRHQGFLVREGLFQYSILERPNVGRLGTFTDSKKAPIHRWFQYPAGFSYKAVEYILDLQKVKVGDVVYDPFTGTGTTNVVCKKRGIKSIGIEAHPFIQNVASVKCTWDYNIQELKDIAEDILLKLSFPHFPNDTPISTTPELVKKCFSEENLKKLLYIKELISNIKELKYKNFFSLALSSALRRSSAAATGWPYIAPKKKILEKDGIESFRIQLFEMISDLESIPESVKKIPSHILLADARNSPLPSASVDLSFTSPPYLNNYDYADRTRLELYFNGFASTWYQITEKIRKKLIISATTQINRNDYDITDLISSELKVISPDISLKLRNSISELSKIRKTKGGKKNYDIMVAQYFNDMTFALVDNFRVLKPGSCFILILGDSAPYGVHIHTEEYLGEIALGIGFKNYSIYKLRERGNKWKANPQRHHVLLKESILTLSK